jgi:hypothetical protein
MTESEVVAVLRTALAAHLEAAFGSYEVDRDRDFVVRRGSARVFVRPLEQAGRTFVRISSVSNVGVSVDGGLTRFLATENSTLAFGKFSLNEEASAVHVAHTLLGDFLNRDELAIAVGAVAEIADRYDDEIKQRFGGRLFTETPEELPELIREAEGAAEPEARPTGEKSLGLQAGFGLLSVLAAIGGALYAYRVEDSIWLSLFVAVLALQLVGRAVPDVLTDPQKVRRALYFLLLPALATGALAGVYELWERWWLSVLAGLLGGLVLNAILAPRLFPRIHREETLDSLRRLAAQLRLVRGA